MNFENCMTCDMMRLLPDPYGTVHHAINERACRLAQNGEISESEMATWTCRCWVHDPCDSFELGLGVLEDLRFRRCSGFVRLPVARCRDVSRINRLNQVAMYNKVAM